MVGQELCERDSKFAIERRSLLERMFCNCTERARPERTPPAR